MRDGADVPFRFWVACAGPEDFGGPLAVGRTEDAVAVFSFEEEALLYLRLAGRGGDLRPIRVSGAQLRALLSGRWSTFGSVALDPVLRGGYPLSATSRERFVRFLASRGGGVTVAAS